MMPPRYSISAVYAAARSNILRIQAFSQRSEVSLYQNPTFFNILDFISQEVLCKHIFCIQNSRKNGAPNYKSAYAKTNGKIMMKLFDYLSNYGLSSKKIFDSSDRLRCETIISRFKV